jgi:hypothetical protein
MLLSDFSSAFRERSWWVGKCGLGGGGRSCSLVIAHRQGGGRGTGRRQGDLRSYSGAWLGLVWPALEVSVAELHETLKLTNTTMGQMILAISLGLGVLIIILVMKTNSKK